MYLRFGYAVGHVGLLGVWAIILLGHMVTIPTAMAIAEIATNQKVEGGGEYYIISRSFGLSIGASIGVTLYISQAISVAFYLIALAEAFKPLIPILQEYTGYGITDTRLISIPSLFILTVLMLTRGAKSGAALLYIIAAVIFTSLVLFFMGESTSGTPLDINRHVEGGESFFKVFAVVFPAFTGMTAGVGLSGDLKKPRQAIPLGVVAATLIGMLIYVFIPYKLAVSASPGDLVANPLIMGDIALWGPIIPIGLAFATISSALGSIMVAPRTLQALSRDGVFLAPGINKRLARISGNGEPRLAILVTSLIALVVIAIGDVNFVAELISMFFMVTYGSLCLVSFMEHFAADPSYRPTFKSRWYISLPGAFLCFFLMFQMRPLYAAGALLSMSLLYLIFSRNFKERGLANIFQGAIFQISRKLQVFLQKANKDGDPRHWRPAIVCLSSHSFERFDALDLLRWISHKYGFGTYIHLIEGYLSRQARKEAQDSLERLIRISDISSSNVYFDTIVSPSYTTAVAQALQLPGISGKENNTVLFEYSRRDLAGLKDIIDNYKLINSTSFDILILGTSPRKFGYKREIHIWITTRDVDNANLMILMGYVIMGHPDWDRGLIRIFNISDNGDKDTNEQESEKLLALVESGRLPISTKHIEVITPGEEQSVREVINERSREADLTIVGFRGETVMHNKSTEAFEGYEDIGNILFVNTTLEKQI